MEVRAEAVLRVGDAERGFDMIAEAEPEVEREWVG